MIYNSHSLDTSILKLCEAALPMNQSYDALRDQLRKALMVALSVSDSYSYSGPYIMDVFPGSVVYSFGGSTYRRSYTIVQGAAGSDPAITLGEAKPCHTAYVDSKGKEAVRFRFDAPNEWEEADLSSLIAKEVKPPEVSSLQVRESVVLEMKKASKKEPPLSIPVKIISPGWGSMAYYGKEMIQSSGPKCFKAGTHMMWNHATDSQEAERPEGDLNDLAAVLIKDAYWDESGPKGPGLYAEAKVFSDYSQQVLEKGPHIGVSINAGIQAHAGEAEGKSGMICDEFVHAYSTDFVTKAGAGGAPVVPVVESQRGGPPQSNQESSMTEQEIAALRAENEDLKTRMAAAEASNNLAMAKATVGAVLKEAGIPFNVKMLDRVCVNPVIKDGAVDEAWVQGIVADFTVDGKSGVVKGMGTREGQSEPDVKAALKESLTRLGLEGAGLEAALSV